MLDNDVAASVASRLGFAMLPRLVRDELGVDAALSTMSCLDTPLALQKSSKLRVVGSPILADSTQLALSLYGSLTTDSTDSFEFTPLANSRAIEQMMLAEVDASLVTAQFLDDSLLREAFLPKQGAKFGELIMVPSWVSGVLPVFRFSDSARARSLQMNGTLPELALSLETLGSIFAGNITTWTDPAISLLNPHINDLYPPDDDATITVVVCCNTIHSNPLILLPSYKTLVITLNLTQSFGSVFKPQGLPFDWDPVIAARPSAKYLYVSTEALVGPIVRATPNSIGVVAKSSNSVDLSWEIQFFSGDLRATRATSQYRGVVSLEQRLKSMQQQLDAGTDDSQTSTESVVVTSAATSSMTVHHHRAQPFHVESSAKRLTSTLDNVLLCAQDTTRVHSDGVVLVDLWMSEQADCWPFSMPSSIVVRSSYSDLVTTTSVNSEFSSSVTVRSCAHGLPALQLAQWLLQSSLIAPLSADTGSILLSSAVDHSTDSAAMSGPAQALSAALHALQSVTCDGETLLVIQPLYWQMPQGLQAVAYAFAAIGVTLVCTAAIAMFCLRHRAVFRSSSPPFLFVSLGGLLLMYISPVFLVASEPTDHTCSALQWTLWLGASTTFAPLFAKSVCPPLSHSE